jgi:hypothetical protein
MPWMIPSHQAPVLPLKLWKPRAFSGLALCLGALAPDLDFILRITDDWAISHTFAAQIYFTVPVVMALHAVLTSLVFPWLVPLLPLGAPLYLEELRLVRPAAGPRACIRVAMSALVGGLSHIVLDGFTHGGHSGWVVPFLPVLATPIPLPIGPTPFHDVLHVLGTIVFGFASWHMAAHVGRKRLIAAWQGLNAVEPVREATRAERRGATAYLLSCALLGMTVGAARGRAEGSVPLEIGVFGAVAFLFYGVLAAAAADRVRLTISGRKARFDPSVSDARG